MKYRYHEGPKINFSYDSLNNPLHIWPDDCADKDYSPLHVLAGWYWQIQLGRKVSIDEAATDVLGQFDLSAAIDIAKNEWKVSEIAESAGVVFTGNGTQFGSMKKMIPHVHAPIKEFDYKKCPNLTVIVPISVTEPVTDEICFNHHSNVPWEQYDFNNLTFDDWREMADNLSVEGEVTRIKLPEMGQYLVVEFDGSHDYHWVDNISNNHYLYLILEGHINES